MKLIKKYLNPDEKILYTGFDWHNRLPISYDDIENEPIPDNAPKSKRTPLLDTPIMVQTTPTASTAVTFGQYMPKYESTPKRELITLGATVAAPFLPSAGQYGLQAMNTAFTPSTWLNPVTGAKLLSPTVGTIADAGVLGAFAYEGLNGLRNQSKQGTLLSDPTSTAMHGLEILPMIGMGARGTQYIYNKAKPFMNFLWNDGKVIQRKMPYNPNNFYREVSKEAIDDAISSGVVRTGDANKYMGPYFAKGSTPWRREKFIIEGYPNKNDWVYAEPYQNAIWLGEEDASLGKKAMEEALNHVPKPQDASIGIHIFPYTNGSVNSTPTSNFTYWQKYPIIGWRQHFFNTSTKPKRIYSKPNIDIMPVEGNITTSDIPTITAENAASITPALWDAAYNKAIVSNNNAEVLRLRDLHFYAKTGETPIIQYRGSSNPTLRNTYYRNDGSAVWFTPDEDAAYFYTPPGTNRPPRAHYIKTKDGKILHVDGATKNFDGSTIPSNWSAIPVENIPENISKHFPEEEINFGKIRFKSKPSYVNTGDIVHAAKLEGYNQVDFQNIIDAKAKSSGVYPQFTTRYYNNIKLADPITYDDAGNIIPLSKRDNFNSSDIRYGILPWIFGGTIGYNYLNQDETSSRYTNGGKLTKHKL